MADSEPPTVEEKPPPARKGFISPTSSFVDFAELETEYFTPEGRERGQFYDPHDNRKIKKPISDTDTCIHLLKGSVGAGLLTMPKAFQNAGIAVGVPGTIILSIICVYALLVLLKMQYIQCKRLSAPFITLPRSMRIGLLNGPGPLRPLAPIAPFLVDFFLVAYQIGICTAYVAFIAECLKHVTVPLWGEKDVRIYMLAIAVPAILINYIRNLKLLVPVSLLANVLIVISLCMCAYYVFCVGPFKVEETELVASPKTWPLFFGTVLFALEAIGVIIALEHNMANPKHFIGSKGIFPWSLTIVVCLYMAVGLLGYLKYGLSTQDTFISSIPRGELLSYTIEGLYAVCIFCSHPLQCFVSLEILWGNYLVRHIKDKNMECIVEYILRTVVVILTVVFAILIPHVDILISLVGSFCISFLGIIMPFLLELCTKWPDELGCCYYVMIKDIILIIIGFGILVLGTYVSLYTLLFAD